MIQPPPSPAQPTDLPQAAEMLCELAVALGDSGTPAHRLEDALVRCSRNLGVRASFFAMPTAVFAAFDAPPHPAPPGSLEISAHTRLIRVQSGETDLARLTDLDGLLDGVSSGRFSVAEARRRIAGVRSRPPLYSRGLTLACFGVVGACAARLFGAGWHEQSAASLAGLGVGATVIYGGRRLGPVADFVAGLLAAAVAVAAAGWFRPCSARTVMLAGLIVLIPGLTLTLAVTELATRNLVAGTARLMGAMTTFVGIGFGAAIGQQAVGRALGVEAVAGTASPSLPDWTLPLSLLLVPFPFAVLFKARPRDVPAIGAAAFTAYYGARLGAWAVGPELGVCIAAILVGVASNVYARVTRRPAAVPLLPGILLLVPGSIGFESVRSFVAHDALTGVSTAFNMLFVAVAIVAGLLIANASAPSRRAL